MSNRERLEIRLNGSSYPIEVGPGLLAELGERCRAVGLEGRPFVVSDDRVAPLYLDWAVAALREAGYDPAVSVLPAGEDQKRLAAIEALVGEAVQAGIDRRSFAVALGGGVVGDVAGFFAAVFMRGIPFVQVPTTLEAQVDAAVGGKTAVNHALGKNLIGAFHQPRLVVSDVETLSSLDTRDLAAGMAEVVKHGVIRDPALFAFVESQAAACLAREASALTRVIVDSCRIKGAIVEADERERGERALLNFGHTVGHAVEAVAGYGQYRHGEAVAVGMVAEADLSRRLLGMPAADEARLVGVLSSLGLPTSCPGLEADAIVSHMWRDKKVERGRLRFALVERIGTARVVEGVAESDARLALPVILGEQVSAEERLGGGA